MNNKIIPVSLAIADKEQRTRLEQLIAANPMVRLMAEDADEMGVLIYEPGENVGEDLPHIIGALEAGQAEDVYLAGHSADPDLLIRAMRSGIREFLQFPVEEGDLRAALMRTAKRLSLGQDQGPRGDLFTVLGVKEGLGVTSLAVNLACVLNEREPGRTVLVDLRCPAGEVPYFLDLKYEYGWGDLVEDISRLDDTYLHSVMAQHDSGLHVLPGPARAETPDEQSLYLILDQLRSSYRYVVVDTAFPHDGHLPKEVEQADRILAVTQLSLPCLARTSRLMEALRAEDPDAERRMGLIANRVTKNAAIGVHEAAEVLDRTINWVIPEDNGTVLTAINQGTPLALTHPKSPVTRAIRALAAELAPEERRARKSLSFSSLFRNKRARGGNRNGLAEVGL